MTRQTGMAVVLYVVPVVIAVMTDDMMAGLGSDKREGRTGLAEQAGMARLHRSQQMLHFHHPIRATLTMADWCIRAERPANRPLRTTEHCAVAMHLHPCSLLLCSSWGPLQLEPL